MKGLPPWSTELARQNESALLRVASPIYTPGLVTTFGPPLNKPLRSLRSCQGGQATMSEVA